MYYPFRHLLILRHCHSLGNHARTLLGKGDETLAKFLRGQKDSAHTHPLTGTGILQAHAVGRWIKQEFGRELFQHKLSSNMVRALETATAIFPSELWTRIPGLRERNWGELDLLSPTERQERYADNLAERDSNPYSWQPPGGESLEVDVYQRILPVLIGIQNGQYSRGNCIAVTHHDVIWLFRYVIEGMSPDLFRSLHLSKDPDVHINNAEILHYSRVNPDTGAFSSADQMWRRVIRPAEDPVKVFPWVVFKPAPALSFE